MQISVRRIFIHPYLKTLIFGAHFLCVPGSGALAPRAPLDAKQLASIDDFVQQEMARQRMPGVEIGIYSRTTSRRSPSVSLPPRFCMCKILLLGLLAANFVAVLRAQPFDLDRDRQPVVSLDGLWRFHPGDNPAWATPGFDDSQWPLIRSDESWTQQGYAGLSGYAWYRFRLQVPDGSKPLSLLLADILTSYRIYADGNLMGAFGDLPPHAVVPSSSLPRVCDLPRSNQHGPRTIQIAIRVWHYPAWAAYVPGGSFEPGNLAGDSSLIHQRLSLLQLIQPNLKVNLYTYSILAALLGLLALGLFFLNRTDREYLWFALLLLASAADAAAQIAEYAPVPIQVFDLADGCLTALFSVAALLFFARVLRARRTLWWWLAVCASSLACFTVALYWSGLTSVPAAGLFEILCLLPSQLWILIVLVRSAVRRNGEARLLILPASLMFGYSLANNLMGLTYQFGWQRIRDNLDLLLLRHPFPLALQDVVNTVFAFFMVAFLIRRFALARREEQRLAGEFEAARSVQSLLIPAAPPATPGFKIESVYLPAQEVGGDFFQVLPGADGSLLIVVGDVSGKGLRAAMTVSTIVGALRNEPDRDPARILRHLGHVLHGNITGFVTCFVARIASDGSLTLANAGHLSPYRNSEEIHATSGLPLGITANEDYGESTSTLAPGDTLTFVSDGVVEARSVQGELFGFDRTRQISSRSSEQIAAAAQAFGQQDDITVLTVQYSPAVVAHA
jgi:phosphoserine phosphatase RsbU/P